MEKNIIRRDDFQNPRKEQGGKVATVNLLLQFFKKEHYMRLYTPHHYVTFLGVDCTQIEGIPRAQYPKQSLTQHIPLPLQFFVYYIYTTLVSMVCIHRRHKNYGNYGAHQSNLPLMGYLLYSKPWFQCDHFCLVDPKICELSQIVFGIVFKNVFFFF